MFKNDVQLFRWFQDSDSFGRTLDAWLFAGSDHGGERAALLHGLIVTAKPNDAPPAWRADANEPVHGAIALRNGFLTSPAVAALPCPAIST